MLLYSAERRSKSAEVSTVVPSPGKVTMPYPSLVGKYEKAIPPEKTSVTGVENNASTSVHNRGGEKMQLEGVSLAQNAGTRLTHIPTCMRRLESPKSQRRWQPSLMRCNCYLRTIRSCSALHSVSTRSGELAHATHHTDQRRSTPLHMSDTPPMCS